MKALAARTAPGAEARPRARVRAAPPVVADEPVPPPPEPLPEPRLKSRTPGRRVRQVREVAREVEALRVVLEEAVRQYELRTAAQLAEILRALYGESGALDRIPPTGTTSAMLRAIRATELKPERGRAKDLVRLRELVAELTELLTSRP